MRGSLLFLLVSILLLFAATEGKGLERDLKIDISTKVSVFPQPGKGEQEDFVASVQVKPDLALFFNESYQAVIAPRFRIGLSDSEYHLISLDDLYLEYVAELFELRVGYQTFFWGTVESVNIVDILNQEDYVGDFLDAEKLGEPSVRARVLLGENRVDFFYFVYFTPAPLPGKVNRFNFFDGFRAFSDDPLYSSSKKRLRQQFAIRWDRSIGSADVGASYFNGYDKFPIINVPPGAEDADSFYYEMQQISGDIQMSLGNWLIKGEAVFQDTSIAGSFLQSSVSENGNPVQRDLVPDDYLAFVAGVEYTFFGLLGRSDLGVLAEYLYNSDQDADTVAFRPFQNDLFGGFRWVRNNPGDGELLAGLIWDVENRSEIWRAEYSERYFDRVKVYVRADRINAALDDPVATFNNDDRFSIELSYTY